MCDCFGLRRRRNAGNANGGTSESGAPAGTPASTESSSTESDQNEKLIVYTNANSDGRGEWLIEKAKGAGFDIEIVGAGGADLTNRLIAEKNNPIADVVYGLNNMLYENLKRKTLWLSLFQAGPVMLSRV